MFTREAVTLIHERSRGIPRTISVICDNALLSGFAVGQRPVNSTTVREVCRDFDLGDREAALPAPVTAPVAAPADEPSTGSGSNLIVIGPAGHAALPVAEPPDTSSEPSDGSLRELYGTAPREIKRRTFSFLRG